MLKIVMRFLLGYDDLRDHWLKTICEPIWRIKTVLWISGEDSECILCPVGSKCNKKPEINQAEEQEV